MRVSVILLFAILVSSVYTVSASAQSIALGARITVDSITQITPVIVPNSPNNKFLTGVSNVGDATGTTKISLEIYKDYGTENEQRINQCTSDGKSDVSVTLSPGGSVSIEWQCTVYGSPGTYHAVYGTKALSFEVSASQGKLYVSKVTVDPIKPKLYDNAVFTVTVKNFNDYQGSKNISYKLIFSSTPPFTASFGTKSITLGPEGSTTFTVNAVFSSSDPWRFYADDYVYDPIVEEAKQQLQKDIDESKTEEEKQADKDREQLKKDIEEETDDDIDDTDEIDEEEEQVTGANLVVTDVIVMPRKGLKQGDAVTITAVVKNSGDAKGSKEIFVQGTVQFHDSATGPNQKHILETPSKTVTVEPGKEKTLKWENVAVLGHGTYYLVVDQLITEFWVGLKNPIPTGIKALDEGIQLDPDEVREAQKTYIRSAPDAEERSKMEAFWKYMSEKHPGEKVRDVDELKTFDIDDVADFDTGAGESSKKPFDIDDVADFDTGAGESGLHADGILSSEDLDRIKNVSDMQVINDMESIRDKILSVDFGSVVGPSDDKSKIKTISEKYDAANDKLRFAIEKREQVVALKQQLEKERSKLDKIMPPDFNKLEELRKKNKSGTASNDDKARLLELEIQDKENSKNFNKFWESHNKVTRLTHEIQDLEAEADKQYNDAMKDLDSAADELDKANQGELNYEDKNQKPFVTDDLKKETYRNQDPFRTVEDLMHITEESIKNMDALQKQNELKQIINEKSGQASSTETFNRIMNSEFASTTFYPGDLQSLTSVTPRVDLQNAVWVELADSGDLAKYKQKEMQKLEQKSESNIEQVSTQTQLVSKLQDSSYFGTIPTSSNSDDVATIHLGGYDASFGNSIISADIPIKSIFDDGNTAKYSVLGGNLALVDPATNQIHDVFSVAFGKGRIGQDGKITFLINTVDSSGLHQTITLSSAGQSSSVMISGGSGFELTSMTISNTIPISDVSEKTTESAITKQVANEFEQYLVYNASTETPSVDEYRKLRDAAKKAEEQKKKAWAELQDAKKAAEESQDPKLKEEVKELEKDLEDAKKESNKAYDEQRKAFDEAKEKTSDLDKAKDQQEIKNKSFTRQYNIDSAPEELKAKYKKAYEKWSQLSDKEKKLEEKLDKKKHEARQSAKEELQKKEHDSFEKWHDAERTSRDLEKKANDAWEKIDKAAKSGRID